MKSKIAAGLFALLLGGLGIHKFYLGQTGMGLLYLLLNLFLFWTFIVPIVIGIVCLVEGILLLVMTDDEFNKKYNPVDH